MRGSSSSSGSATTAAASSSRKRRTPSTNACTRTSKRVRLLQQPHVAIGPGSAPTSASTLPAAPDCVKCGAIKFAFETSKFCCSDGEVHLANNEFPSELIDLFGGNDDKALNFKKYARLYNNMFAFSSLGGSTEADSKKGLFPQLKSEVISIIMFVLERNPYATFFKSMREIDIEENTRVIISHNPSLDQPLYNAPEATKVAALLLDNSHALAANSPHIIVYGKSAEPHRVMHYYGCYDPLQYPLLYPKGECGWHQGIKKRLVGRRQTHVNPTFPVSSALIQDAADLITAEATASSRRPPKEGKEVSCREYYAYKFQIRSGEEIRVNQFP